MTFRYFLNIYFEVGNKLWTTKVDFLNFLKLKINSKNYFQIYFGNIAREVLLE